ncbi:MAG: hypothetical protein M1365_09600, partial [Actinobacteria bacterium]|nr:hypothetical protein [Actinomycetota bacterium]
MAGVKTSEKKLSNTKILTIDSDKLNYKDLNLRIREFLAGSECSSQIPIIELKNILGIPSIS